MGHRRREGRERGGAWRGDRISRSPQTLPNVSKNSFQTGLFDDDTFPGRLSIASVAYRERSELEELETDPVGQRDNSPRPALERDGGRRDTTNHDAKETEGVRRTASVVGV